jgi:4-hydroxy-3-methylbut-2-enyl diphosphate reductase
MKIIRANVLGFCMGVRRAVELACAEALRVPAGQRVCTLGPLIHNPRTLEDLKSRGVEILDETDLPPDLAGASIIIRAHGASPRVEAALRKRGAQVVDATCPRVKDSQLKAQALAETGYGLFLAGEAHHAEIAGILGYVRAAGGAEDRGAFFCAVVGNAAEAEAAAARFRAAGSEDGAAALIGQTTISEEEYRAIGDGIKKYFPNLEIVQTICAATKARQESLRELLDRVDAVVIAGGKESANTRRLLAIARESGKPSVLAESAAGIPPEFAAFETVGVCAGASTPDSVIEEIETALQELPSITSLQKKYNFVMKLQN